MTGILEELKWESLKKGRRDGRLILFYKGLKGKASILTDDLIPPHPPPPPKQAPQKPSLAFQVPSATTDIYKVNFFPRTTRDWNALPDSLVCSAEGADDSVARFTSLVRARD